MEIVKRQVVFIDVEKEGSQGRFQRNVLFQAWQPALLAVTGCKGETLVSDKLHDHFDHVHIPKKPQQLSDKAMVQDTVISRCQNENTTQSFFEPPKNPRYSGSAEQLDPRLASHVKTQIAF